MLTRQSRFGCLRDESRVPRLARRYRLHRLGAPCTGGCPPFAALCESFPLPSRSPTARRSVSAPPSLRFLNVCSAPDSPVGPQCQLVEDRGGSRTRTGAPGQSV